MTSMVGLSAGILRLVWMVLPPILGTRKLVTITSVLMILLIYPMFALLRAYPTIGALLALQAVSGIFKAAYSGPMPALMSEIFPTRVRSTGLSLGYSLGVTLFGGFAPFIVTWLIKITGSPLAPAVYLTVIALIAMVAIFRSRAIHGSELTEEQAHPEV